MQNIPGVPIKDCDFAVHFTKSFHSNFLAGIDKFPAEFKSIVAYFEIYDSVQMHNRRRGVDQRATGDNGVPSFVFAWVPRADCRAVDADAPTGCHRDERVAATSRGEPVVLFWHLDAVKARNARAALHKEQLDIFRESLAYEHSWFTQCTIDLYLSVGLHALRFSPNATVAAQSRQPLALPPVIAQTHKQRVRVAQMTHTPNLQYNWPVLWGSVHVAQVAGVVAQTDRAHHSVVPICEEQLVTRRVVAHSMNVGIFLADSGERLLRDAVNELKARGEWERPSGHGGARTIGWERRRGSARLYFYNSYEYECMLTLNLNIFSW